MKASSGCGMMMPEVHLFHSRRKFDRFCKGRLGGKVEDYGTQGQMTYCDGVAAVYMGYAGDEMTELTLLVHESYHAAYHHMQYIGEDEPGEEVMAYLIQSIAHALFVAHGKWRKRKA